MDTNPREKHILIVEDDRSMADFLSIALRYEGFCVTIARDGDTAMASIKSSKIDLVLLDMMLPNKSIGQRVKLWFARAF